jgi:hypothetical protein
MFFFALVMLIQMIGMLLHRIMTLGHIVSSTSFRYILYTAYMWSLENRAWRLFFDKYINDGQTRTS